MTAPGVHVLAAHSPVASLTGIVGDKRSVPFFMLSGTSMACPHATAIAAYVKSFYPTWSEAAIRSALMTTGKYICIYLHLNYLQITISIVKLLD